jgi:hypothetical protein
MTPWPVELIRYLDEASSIAQTMQADPYSKDPKVLLQTLLNSMAQIKAQVLEGSLDPPKTIISLGLARFVTDWVDDLNGPLHHKVSQIEQHYLFGSKIIADGNKHP